MVGEGNEDLLDEVTPRVDEEDQEWGHWEGKTFIDWWALGGTPDLAILRADLNLNLKICISYFGVDACQAKFSSSLVPSVELGS